MSGIEHNAHPLGQAFRGAAGQVRRELVRELDVLAERAAVSMRLGAPKFRTTLANSVRVERPGELERVIKPTAAYAWNVERGRKPGRGLPRFFDPAAASAVAWLESRIAVASRKENSKWRPGKIGSKRRTRAEVELRDRYMAWSRHVKLYGIKAQPFVKPVADELRSQVPGALMAAWRRGMWAAGVGRGAAL